MIIRLPRIAINPATVAAAILSTLLAAFGPGALHAENAAAATRSLERAIALVSAGEWSAAAFEAGLGETYAPRWADFPYLASLASIGAGASRAESVAHAERSLAEGLQWRSYNRAGAMILCASLYADTVRYREALALLDGTGALPTADADYARLRSLYGLGRVSEARALMGAILDRWPYDARFPRLFFLREEGLVPDATALKIAGTLVSRLYLWEDEDRELLLLAVPYIPDAATRVRNIREYRGMGSSDKTAGSGTSPLSALRALEYGLLSEDAALDEIIGRDEALDFSILSESISLCGSETARTRLALFLASFAGTILMDRNGDEIFDAGIAYRFGRPVFAEIDLNQDGIADYTVSCELGAPVSMTLADKTTVHFDTYPAVREVHKGNDTWEMRPLSLSWKPVSWVAHEFELETEPFYTLEARGAEPPLTERLLEANAFRRTRPTPLVEGGTERILYRDGTPISSEVRLDGRVYAWTSWTAGVPALVRMDRDGDGYLETTQVNDAAGLARSISIDRDGDSRVDYREEYGANGSSKLAWDTDGNGTDDIVRSIDKVGLERVEWKHPVTGLSVILTVERGQPRGVSYNGVTQSIVRDPAEALWWIGSPPAFSRELAKKALARVNQSSTPVVLMTQRDDGANLLAVAAGGLVFAELLDD